MRRVFSLWRGEMIVTTGPTWKDTAREVAQRHGLTLEDLIGPDRRRKVAHARHEAFAHVHKAHVLSSVRIGQLFGGRDHSTVLHGIRQHRKRTACPE